MSILSVIFETPQHIMCSWFHRRQQDQERRITYKKELQAMKQRVASRPLVFEQVSHDAARRAAEIKYMAALKRAGLSEEEIKSLNQHLQDDVKAHVQN